MPVPSTDDVHRPVLLYRKHFPGSSGPLFLEESSFVPLGPPFFSSYRASFSLSRCWSCSFSSSLRSWYSLSKSSDFSFSLWLVSDCNRSSLYFCRRSSFFSRSPPFCLRHSPELILLLEQRVFLFFQPIHISLESFLHSSLFIFHRLARLSFFLP